MQARGKEKAARAQAKEEQSATRTMGIEEHNAVRARLMAQIVEMRQQMDGLTTRRSRPKLQQHLTALEKQQPQVLQKKQQAKGKNQVAAAEKKHAAAATKRRGAEEEEFAEQEQIWLAKKLALAGRTLRAAKRGM